MASDILFTQPCTLRDFMDYLLYIEHAAEHLQFFMWFRGYLQRFDSLPASEKALAPEWTHQDERNALEEWKKLQANIQKRQPHTAANEVFRGTVFAKEGPATVVKAGIPYAGFGSGNPFVTPPATPHGRQASRTSDDSRIPTWDGSSNQSRESSRWESSRSKDTASTVAHDTFQNAGLSQPCKGLPSPIVFT
jgi:hypothetical protein